MDGSQQQPLGKSIWSIPLFPACHAGGKCLALVRIHNTTVNRHADSRLDMRVTDGVTMLRWLAADPLPAVMLC